MEGTGSGHAKPKLMQCNRVTNIIKERENKKQAWNKRYTNVIELVEKKIVKYNERGLDTSKIVADLAVLKVMSTSLDQSYAKAKLEATAYLRIVCTQSDATSSSQGTQSSDHNVIKTKLDSIYAPVNVSILKITAYIKSTLIPDVNSLIKANASSKPKKSAKPSSSASSSATANPTVLPTAL
ncbi:MAG: hypothetical protein M3P33_02015, partial [bacterium]|nr:hypothetical protein [bacterium]